MNYKKSCQATILLLLSGKVILMKVKIEKTDSLKNVEIGKSGALLILLISIFLPCL